MPNHFLDRPGNSRYEFWRRFRSFSRQQSGEKMSAWPVTATGRFFLTLSLGLAMALTAACIKSPPSYETAPDLTADIFEAAENSLPIVVTDLKWSVILNGSHLRANGLVRNIGQRDYQSVTLYAEFLDERGKSLGRGSTFITPSYLPPGKEGAFEITIMMTPGTTVKNIRLISNAQVLN